MIELFIPLFTSIGFLVVYLLMGLITFSLYEYLFKPSEDEVDALLLLTWPIVLPFLLIVLLIYPCVTISTLEEDVKKLKKQLKDIQKTKSSKGKKRR